MTEKSFNNYKVVVRVKDIKGKCWFGYKVGDTFEFDGDEMKGRICLMALGDMFTNVALLMFGAEIPWARGKDKIITQMCPDMSGQVLFEMRRVRKE